MASGQTSWASPGALSDRVDRQPEAAFRSAIAAADTTAGAATKKVILDTPAFLLYNAAENRDDAKKVQFVRSTVAVSAVFSDASATCTIEVWRVGLDEKGQRQLKGFTTLSFTAQAALKAAAYWSEEQYVASLGSHELRFLVTALSAGTLSIRAGSV